MNDPNEFAGIDTGLSPRGGRPSLRYNRSAGVSLPIASPTVPKPISFDCPYCQAVLEAAVSQAGESLSCPHCDGVFLVPIPIAGKSAAREGGSYSSGYRGSWPPSEIMTPLQVSAIGNLVVGALYILSLFGSIVGVGLVVLGWHELQLHKKARGQSPAVFLEKVSQIAIFEIVAGIFNIISLPCGIINLLQTSKLKSEM